MDPTTGNASATHDRRSLRSEISYQAAEFYLGTLKHRKLLRAVALSDENGLLLTGIGAERELELLALWGALEPYERSRYQTEIAALCAGGTCISRRFQIDAASLCVTGIASTDECGVALVRDLKRIFRSLHGPCHDEEATSTVAAGILSQQEN